MAATELDYVSMNALSDALKRLICASFWSRLEFFESVPYEAYEAEIEGICQVLQFLDLAEIVRSEPCKILRDEEGNLAVGQQSEDGEDGMREFWDATPQLVEMIKTRIPPNSVD